MPKRIVRETVLVRRPHGPNGKRFHPPIGEVFSFTTDEVLEIHKQRPTALEKLTGVDDDEGFEDDIAARTGPVAIGDPGDEPEVGSKNPAADVGAPAPGAKKGKPVKADEDVEL